MAKRKEQDSASHLTEIAVFGIQEKKGKDIVTLDLRKLHSAVSDFFIICNADSGTQVRAIADSVEYELQKSMKENPWHKEGFENSDWIILDYVNVVVHIFKTDKRAFYGVEDLWGDAEVKLYQSA